MQYVNVVNTKLTHTIIYVHTVIKHKIGLGLEEVVYIKTKKTKKKTKSKGFSKKLLILDYIITGVLILIFSTCAIINGVYAMSTIDTLIDIGIDVSMITISPPFNLDVFGIIIGVWVAQLAISTGAYYIMARSDHKIQLPIYLINELPDDVKSNVDMTQLITTVLTSTDN